jgi:hypothetical protein
MSESEIASELIDETVIEMIKEDEAGEGPRWHKQVALFSLILALLAALAGLLAGLSAHEDLHRRTEEIMELSRLENDLVHIEVLRTKHELLYSLGRDVDPAELAQIQAFEEEAEDLVGELTAEERQDRSAGSTHLILAITVTLLSVGITISGMAVVVGERRLWYAGMVFGAGGTLCLALGIVRMLA